jgi:hypothetical protein
LAPGRRDWAAGRHFDYIEDRGIYLKRKPAQPPVERVISSDLLEAAKKSVQPDTLKRTAKCVVCGSECSPSATEPLCWVCRRLKVSAWRDSDQPMTAQE